MSTFGGQFGSFGGGYMTGNAMPGSAPAMQFGGGFITAGSPPVVPGEVVYQMGPVNGKPRDRSGRRGRYNGGNGGWPFENGVQGGVHRQKRY